MESNKPTEIQRLSWIDMSRGFAISLVVLGHVIANGQSAGVLSNPIWGRLSEN